jgi:hypothetical protein
MRGEVLAYAERHGFADRLHLPGRVSDMGNWFRAMDLQLLTSEREGCPTCSLRRSIAAFRLCPRM